MITSPNWLSDKKLQLWVCLTDAKCANYLAEFAFRQTDSTVNIVYFLVN